MYKIIPLHGHYDVYINGKFYCSTDTWSEAEMEIREYKKGEIVC